MNEGVKILLERIKTNPEEFYDDTNGLHVTTRWGRILTDYQNFLDPEDRDALKEAMNKLHQEKFTQLVMKELLDPEEDDGLGKWYTGQKTGTPLGGATLGQSWVNTQLQQAETQSQIDHMKAHHDWLIRQKQLEKQEHNTLFGRLKNYLHADT